MSAVDSVTADLAATTMTDNNAPADAAHQTDAVAASAAEGRRLYIGNLAYATKEGELKDFFKDYLVESVSIPVNPRTNRPVGYAFVDLSTPSEAERAIAALNSQTILERKVSIQLARKPEPHVEGDASGKEGASGGEARRRGSTRGRGRGRGRGGRSARGGRAATKTNGEVTDDAASTDPAHANVSSPSPKSSKSPKSSRTSRKPLSDMTNTSNNQSKGTEGAAAEKGKAPRTPRTPKQRGPPEDGVASKTKVMVANLPYDLGEDKLMDLFKDYSPQSAKIALRPIPRFMIKKLASRNEPRKGRGFGFVTLASEEMQQKACTEMNGKEIEGREIAVKVAIDSPGKEDDDVVLEGEGHGENGVAAPAEAEKVAVAENEKAAPEPAATTA